ncbi:MAG: NAD-dependent epimerase/dehydratase family protein [Spirochaetia bacterium]|nr:NAD-dependent epimerase/dehydratase family protein [Spirochaetia bacterium]
MKVILTGATGMVGEGVLFECLENSAVTDVLIVGRKPYNLKHPKLSECIVSDFLKTDEYADELKGYDACFYCAGISSIGMDEARYTTITYDTTMAFARCVFARNPKMVFNYVTGRSTDSTAQGKVMWARVKGKTENSLMELGFKGQYNFRPALMLPTKGQKSVRTSIKIASDILKYIMPKSTITLKVLGQAMINAVVKGYPRQVLEVADIRILADGKSNPAV